MNLSKSQVDRLGERLRRGEVPDEDIQLLDAYRTSFAEPYAFVLGSLRDRLGLAPTGREKTTKSVVDKLRRESVRLSQIQDIAGCRVVVPGIGLQDQTVQAIRNHFGDVEVVDRRARPSHGYRAVHLVVPVGERRVEVQVRTALQQRWAELSEKLSDTLGIAVKYGGGDPDVQALLRTSSEKIDQIERMEGAQFRLEWRETLTAVPRYNLRDLRAVRAEGEQFRDELRTILEEVTAEFLTIARAYNALPD